MVPLACDNSYWARQLRHAQTYAHDKTPQLFNKGTQPELLLPRVRLRKYFFYARAQSDADKQVFAITKILDANPTISVAFRRGCRQRGVQWTTPKQLNTPFSIMNHIDTFVVCQDAIIDVSMAYSREIDGLTLTEWQLLEKFLAVLSVSIIPIRPELLFILFPGLHQARRPAWSTRTRWYL